MTMNEDNTFEALRRAPIVTVLARLSQLHWCFINEPSFRYTTCFTKDSVYTHELQTDLLPYGWTVDELINYLKNRDKIYERR